MIRPDWDEWGLLLTDAVAKRADCTRRKVGAVIMRPGHTIVSTGYNGAPSGVRGCIGGGCPRSQSGVEPGSSYDTGAGTCIALHAEQNALLRASWDEMQDSTLYVSENPCDGCLRMISGSPVRFIITPKTKKVLK